MASSSADPVAWPFDNSYARLPDRFYASLAPEPAPEPRLIRLNRALAEVLGLDAGALEGPDGARLFTGSALPPGAEPLAMAYAGHQFGQFVPQLGDGRAHLMGEIVGQDGIRRDIQFKGSGRTPFSRMGDGRAALGPVMREYIVSEGMAGLGIPSSRALAMALTGQAVVRDTGPEPGAVLTRVARSHVRVGTFQFFAARQDEDGVRTLADYVIARHYPEVQAADQPYLAFYEQVIARTAELVAQWQLVGFIHGVMNTDNQSIAGETIDFGPCAFLDGYHPDKVFSSIDVYGRYAYKNQPPIAAWNMARLAETLLPVFDADEEAALAKAQTALDRFIPAFEAALHAGWRAKLGLAEARDGDMNLAVALLDAMAAAQADFTRTFRALSHLSAEPGTADGAVRAEFGERREGLEPWLPRWRARLAEERRTDADRQAAMRAVNPAYIPRNHQVERAIQAARRDQDYGVMDALVAVIARPFEDHPGQEAFAAAPSPDQEVKRTFCGT